MEVNNETAVQAVVTPLVPSVEGVHQEALVDASGKRLKNQVTILFEQDDVKIVKRKGQEVKKPVKHHVMFTDAVDTSVSSEQIANYLIAKLYHYQEMQRLQGAKGRFDTSLPINLTILVNGDKKASKLKFSTNAKTLGKLLETTPRLMGWLYNPTQLGLGCTKDDIMSFVNETNVIVAKAIEQPVQPAIENNDDNIEEVEVVEEVQA